jgi:hypothetical protein
MLVASNNFVKSILVSRRLVCVALGPVQSTFQIQYTVISRLILKYREGSAHI